MGYNNIVYNVLCVHRPRKGRCKACVFEKLIRILYIVDAYFSVYRYYRYLPQENSICT